MYSFSNTIMRSMKSRSALDMPGGGLSEGVRAAVGAAKCVGMRISWPAARRASAFMRPPSTRTWPVRTSFCTSACGSDG